jgi:DNA-binding transcriptional ArsR family regulator
MKELKGYFRALGDVGRLRILAQLAESGDLSVSELARQLRMSQPLVSWHLRTLRRAGLVRMQKIGRVVHCSLNREILAAYQHDFARLMRLETASSQHGR